MKSTEKSANRQYLARARAEWLRDLSRDKTVSAVAFRVAFVIADHLNLETGVAWPSIPTISEAVGLGQTATKKAVADLVAGGHLRLIAGRGRGHSNRYRIADKTVATATVITNKTVAIPTVFDEENSRFGPAKQSPRDGKTVALPATNLLKNLPTEPNHGAGASSATAHRGHVHEPTDPSDLDDTIHY